MAVLGLSMAVNRKASLEPITGHYLRLCPDADVLYFSNAFERYMISQIKAGGPVHSAVITACEKLIAQWHISNMNSKA